MFLKSFVLYANHTNQSVRVSVPENENCLLSSKAKALTHFMLYCETYFSKFTVIIEIQFLKSNKIKSLLFHLVNWCIHYLNN